MQAPRLEKIVLNMGIGSLTTAKQDYKTFVSDLGLIAGQTPVIAYSRKSISNFKLREGMPVGIMVTLRGDAMYAFLEKLIAVVLPRVRDFVEFLQNHLIRRKLQLWYQGTYYFPLSRLLSSM